VAPGLAGVVVGLLAVRADDSDLVGLVMTWTEEDRIRRYCQSHGISRQLYDALAFAPRCERRCCPTARRLAG
jgi:hypothetical protein